MLMKISESMLLRKLGLSEGFEKYPMCSKVSIESRNYETIYNISSVIVKISFRS